MMLSLFNQNSSVFCILLIITLLFGASNASAQQVGPGCDPAFMRAMQDKAWMEAQREIMIAQATIAKPDSVFSLGCYQYFSGSYSTSFTSGSAGNYTGLIAGPIGNYLSASFDHNFGGGHSPIARSDSLCDAMLRLWNQARGTNLESPSKLLGTLIDISTYDRGAFPTTLTAPSGFTAPLNKFFGAKTANQSVGSGFDDMNLFAGVTAPFSQLTSPNTKCAPGIETGVMIGNEKEKICPNPGCIPSTGSSPKCCRYTATSSSDASCQ